MVMLNEEEAIRERFGQGDEFLAAQVTRKSVVGQMASTSMGTMERTQSSLPWV